LYVKLSECNCRQVSTQKLLQSFQLVTSQAFNTFCSEEKFSLIEILDYHTRPLSVHKQLHGKQQLVSKYMYSCTLIESSVPGKSNYSSPANTTGSQAHIMLTCTA